MASPFPASSDAVRALALYLTPPADPNANPFRVMLIQHFVGLGYKVSEVPSSADVIVNMAFSVSPYRSEFRVGPWRPPLLNVHVMLTAEGGGFVLGSSSGDFILGEPPPADRLDALCVAVMSGPRVEDFARRRGVDGAPGISRSAMPTSARTPI